MYELMIETRFAAAHRLREYDGRCEQLHGHNWKIEVVLKGEELGPLGMLMDFRDVKDLIARALDEYDHTFLNELPQFQESNPTTENIARNLFTSLSAKLPAGVHMAKVTAWESDGCGGTYYE